MDRFLLHHIGTYDTSEEALENRKQALTAWEKGEIHAFLSDRKKHLGIRRHKENYQIFLLAADKKYNETVFKQLAAKEGTSWASKRKGFRGIYNNNNNYYEFENDCMQ